MPQHQPAPGQQELRVDRGHQFRLLRRVRTGSPSAKAMLLALDSHIGRGTSWTMTHEELAHEIEISVPSAYRISAALEKAGFIRRVSVGGKRVAFSICWGILWSQFDEIETEPETTEAADASTATVIAHENAVIAHENGILTGKNSIIAHENAPYNGTLENSSPTSPEADERTAVMKAVKGAGIDEFGTAVELAESRGMTLGQIRDLVAYFVANPGRYPVGVLYHRLTKPGAALQAPDEGWFGDDPKRAAAAKQQAQADVRETLETRLGPVLDRMTVEQWRSLAEKASPREQVYLRTAIEARQACGRFAAVAREQFLQLLHRHPELGVPHALDRAERAAEPSGSPLGTDARRDDRPGRGEAAAGGIVPAAGGREAPVDPAAGPALPQPAAERTGGETGGNVRPGPWSFVRIAKGDGQSRSPPAE
jgi:Fe2+ or Zn2+ uptake regulation protein